MLFVRSTPNKTDINPAKTKTSKKQKNPNAEDLTEPTPPNIKTAVANLKAAQAIADEEKKKTKQRQPTGYVVSAATK